MMLSELLQFDILPQHERLLALRFSMTAEVGV